MITIDKDRKLLLMYHDHAGDPSKNIKDKMYNEINEYQLISGYICPKCERVLKAYYIGVPSHIRTGVNNPFFKSPRSSYSSAPTLSLKEGTNAGGSYLNLEYHENLCDLKVFEYRGILDAVSIFYKNNKPQDSDPLTHEQLQLLANRILAGQVPGLKPVYDVCSVDEPLLAVNANEIGTYKGSVWINEKTIDYMVKYAAPELPSEENTENTEDSKAATQTSVETCSVIAE